MELEQDTPEVDVDVNAEGEGHSETENADQPFLRVNDRTEYKTREDAIKGFDEAGKRIAAWSHLERTYGVRDPETASQLFDELLTLRNQIKDLQTKKDDGKPVSEAKTEQLSNKAAAAIKWLEENGTKAGFLSKKEVEQQIKALEERITQLQQGSESQSEEAYSERLESSTSTVVGWLTSDGVQNAEAKMKSIVGPLIKEYINADDKGPDSRVARWNRGGSSMQKVVKEAYDTVVKDLGWAKATGSAERALSKGKAVAAPKGTAAPKKETSPTAKNKAVWDEAGDAAWEEYQKTLKAQG